MTWYSVKSFGVTVFCIENAALFLTNLESAEVAAFYNGRTLRKRSRKLRGGFRSCPRHILTDSRSVRRVEWTSTAIQGTKETEIQLVGTVSNDSGTLQWILALRPTERFALKAECL
jgi:hypothetical protein